MTENIKKSLSSILSAIENIVDGKINKLKFDSTYRGKIISQLNDNSYKVQVNGAEYTVNYSGYLPIGSVVRVKAPLNNFSDIYIESSLGGNILFSGESYEEITLANNVNNYSCIDIEYKDSNNVYGSQRIYAPFNKHVILSIVRMTSSHAYISAASVLVNGTKILFDWNREASTWTTIENNNTIKITKIIGYKQ